MRKRMLCIIAATIFGTMLAGCSNPGSENNNLSFNISNAKALIVESPQGGLNYGDSRLLKRMENGETKSAVSGISGQFVVDGMMRNPVTQSIIIGGHFSGKGSTIEIHPNSSYQSVRTTDSDYHYYSNSGFDKDGAFYFSTSSSTPNAPGHTYKYINGKTTSLMQSSDISPALYKVLANGYLVVRTDQTYLRAPSGALTRWEGDTYQRSFGIYSSYNDVYYFNGNDALNFSTGEKFKSGATVGMGDDFDAMDYEFVIIEKEKAVKYRIQSGNTLNETVLMSGYEIKTTGRTNHFPIQYCAKYNKNSGTLYFVGKQSGGNNNLYMVRNGGTPEALLTGMAADDYSFSGVWFSENGEFIADVMQLSTGRYGLLEGDFLSGYKFIERENGTVITDVLWL